MNWHFSYGDLRTIQTLIQNKLLATKREWLADAAKGSSDAALCVAIEIIETISAEAERRQLLHDAAEYMQKALEDARELICEHWPDAKHDQRERDLVNSHRSDAIIAINNALTRCNPIEF